MTLKPIAGLAQGHGLWGLWGLCGLWGLALVPGVGGSSLRFSAMADKALALGALTRWAG